MKKEIIVTGMSCGHCINRVEGALKPLAGVTSVEVQLKEGKVLIGLSQDISDEVLKEAIDEAGYDVVAIHQL